MAGCYDSGDEPSGSINCEEFFDKLEDLQASEEGLCAVESVCYKRAIRSSTAVIFFPQISDECFVSY